MKKEQVRAASILAALLVFAGLVVMFCSPVFGQYLGSAWLSGQGGMADTGDYMMVTKTYIHSFLITGSIFLTIGTLAGLVTYMAVLVYGVKDEEFVATTDDNETGNSRHA